MNIEEGRVLDSINGGEVFQLTVGGIHMIDIYSLEPVRPIGGGLCICSKKYVAVHGLAGLPSGKRV